MRRYIGYKAEAAGIAVVDTVNEAYTSQTCPRCGHRSKPKGRTFVCHVCGFRCARDTVGAANILFRHLHGEVGRVLPPPQTMYRYPFARSGALRAIYQNLVFSLGILAVVVGLAIPGILQPVSGALLHELSSIPVIATSARLIGFKERSSRTSGRG